MFAPFLVFFIFTWAQVDKCTEGATKSLDVKACYEATVADKKPVDYAKLNQ